MLPAGSRLTHRDDFSQVIRRGRRSGRTLVVMHALSGGTPSHRPQGFHGPRVGFVVSKAVGGSVVRHRVARRLRHVMRDRLAGLPPGTDLVVRALPRAAAAESALLADEIDRALRTVVPAAERR